MIRHTRRLLAKPLTTHRALAMSSPSRTYADALAHLNTLIPNLKIHALFNNPKPLPAATATPSDPNALAIPEMRAWLARADLTPDLLSRISYIHVAGTKGKGSVTALLTSALLSSSSPSSPSPRIGTYTSPHLVSPRERIALDGVPVSQPLFAKHFFALWDALSSAPADPALGIDAGSKPFYFRYLTLLALRIFLAEGVSSAVVECGIGAEHDATNILPPASVTASVVTQLGIDHVAMLGSTPEQIARHKAGVMKPAVATFTRRQDDRPGVMAVLRARAADLGAALVEVPDDEVAAWAGVPGARLPGGAFQKRNQALAALAARHHLRVLEAAAGNGDQDRGIVRPETSLSTIPDPIIAGLRSATLRGRHEVIHQGPVSWHLDGAHNAESLAEVSRWISALLLKDPSSTPFVLVFNQQERDASELLLGLLSEMEACGVDVASRLARAIFTRNDKTRIEDADLRVQQGCADALAKAYPGVKTSVCADLGEMTSAVDAVVAASGGAGTKTKVLVTGSMYLVGNVIGFLEPDSLS